MIAPILGPDFTKSATIDNGLSAAELQSAHTNFDSGLIGTGLAASEAMRQMPNQMVESSNFVFNNLLGQKVYDPTLKAYLGRDSSGLIGRAYQETANEDQRKERQESLKQMERDTEAAYNELTADGQLELYAQDLNNRSPEEKAIIGKATKDTVSGKLIGSDADIMKKLTDPNGEYKLQEKDARHIILGKNKASENQSKQAAQDVRTLQIERNLAIDDINNEQFTNVTGNPNYTYQDGYDHYNRILIAGAGLSIDQFAMEIRKNNGIEGTSGAAQLKKIYPSIDLKKLEREVLVLEKIGVDSRNAKNGVPDARYLNGEMWRVSQAQQARGVSTQQANLNAMLAAGATGNDFAEAEKKNIEIYNLKRLKTNQSFNEIKDEKGNVIGYDKWGGSKTTTSTSTSSSKKVIGPGSGTGKATGVTQEEGGDYNVYYHGKDKYEGVYVDSDFDNGVYSYDIDNDSPEAQTLQQEIRLLEQDLADIKRIGDYPEEQASIQQKIDEKKAQLSKLPPSKASAKQEEFAVGQITSVTKNGVTKYYRTDPNTGEKIELDYELRNDGKGNVEWVVDRESGKAQRLRRQKTAETTTTKQNDLSRMNPEIFNNIKVIDPNTEKLTKPTEAVTVAYTFKGKKGFVMNQTKKGDSHRYGGEDGLLIQDGDTTRFMPGKYLKIISYDTYYSDYGTTATPHYSYDKEYAEEQLAKDGLTLKDLDPIEMIYGNDEQKARQQNEEIKQTNEILRKIGTEGGIEDLTQEELDLFAKRMYGVNSFRDLFEEEPTEDEIKSIKQNLKEYIRSYQLDPTNPLMMGDDGSYSAAKGGINILKKNFLDKYILGTSMIGEDLEKALNHADYDKRKEAIKDILSEHKSEMRSLGEYIGNEQITDFILEVHNILSDKEKTKQYHNNVYNIIYAVATKLNLQDMIKKINKETMKPKTNKEKNNNK